MKRQRYLRAEEHLLLQGIWPWTYEGSACKALKDLARSTAARSCAGNAFSTTTALAACLASLVSSSGWFVIAQRHHSDPIPEVPGECLDDSSRSLKRAALQRGISSSEASSFAPCGLSLQQCRHQVVIFETLEGGAEPHFPEVPTSGDSGGKLDDWLGNFFDQEEELCEEEEKTRDLTNEALHQVKPVPTSGSECLRTPRATKHEVQNDHFSSKKRKAPHHGRKKLRDQGGHPASNQCDSQRKDPGSHRPEVEGEVPGLPQPEVQFKGKPSLQKNGG